MPVSSFIEIYTTLLGWYMYEGIWGVLTGSGIAIIPFVLVAAKIILEDSAQNEKKRAGDLVRKLEFSMYTMFLVFVLAAQPFINIYPENVSFVDTRCVVDGNIVEKETTETSGLDNDTALEEEQSPRFAILLGDRQSRAPIWWYISTKLSAAFTHSIKHELPCTADLRTLSTHLSNAEIRDDELREEASLFFRDCYLPSTNKYLRERPPIPAAIDDDEVDRDLSWYGSRIFQQSAGYYDTFRAQTGLASFPYSEIRDSNMVSPEASDGKGYPACLDWWRGDGGVIVGDQGSLRERLLNDVKGDGIDCSHCDLDNSIWDYYAARIFASDEEADDTLLRILLKQDTDLQQLETMTINDSLNGDSAGTNIKDFFVGVAMLKDTALGSGEATVYRTGAPIIQAFALMLFYILLPIIMVISLYEIEKLFMFTLFQFSMIFWTFLFALGYWIDNFMLEGLLGHSGGAALVHEFFTSDLILNGQSSDGKVMIQVLIWISRLSYLVLPLLSSYLLTMAGIKAGGFANALSGSLARPAQSGNFRNLKLK